MEIIGVAAKAAAHAVEGARVIQRLAGTERSEMLDELHNVFRTARAQERQQEIQQTAGQIGASSAQTAGGTTTGVDETTGPDTDSPDPSDADGGGILETVSDAVSGIVDWFGDLF
jgi:hypothetical protein